MFPCTPLVYSLGALCSFFIYILLFTDKKKDFNLTENHYAYRRVNLVKFRQQLATLKTRKAPLKKIALFLDRFF